MSFFLDTNVLIGFIFCQDFWHEKALNVIFSDNNLYYSNSVESEYYKKFDEKYNILYNFFSELSLCTDLIKKPMNRKDFIKTINQAIEFSNFNDDEKRDASILLWKKYGLGDFVDNLHLSNLINETTIELKDFFENRQEVLFNDLKKTPIRKKPYTEIKESVINLRDKYGNDCIHPEDEIILLDAHDFACNNDCKLFFVTGDKKFFNSINYLIRTLSLERACYLEEFN